MIIELGFALPSKWHARQALRALRQLPSLSEGAVYDLHLQRSGSGRELVARASFDDLTEAARSRVVFWMARAGARIRSRPAPAAANRDRPRLARGAPLEPPVLTLLVRGPGWEGVTFERATRQLFIPGLVTPPIGDRVALRLLVHEVGEIAAGARVVEPARTAPRRDGYTLALDPGAAVACAVLAGTPEPCPALAGAPRYRARGPVVVTTRDGAARRVTGHLRDLSWDGARLRTQAALEPGTPVVVDVPLNAAFETQLRARVARVERESLEVSFEPDQPAAADLAAFLTTFPGRRRRALLLDEYAPTRRAAALELRRRGFDVFATGDVVHGLQVLAADSVTTDALVAGELRMTTSRLVAATVRAALGDPGFPVLGSSEVAAGIDALPAGLARGATRTLTAAAG